MAHLLIPLPGYAVLAQSLVPRGGPSADPATARARQNLGKAYLKLFIAHSKFKELHHLNR
jgi:hypothetical protein